MLVYVFILITKGVIVGVIFLKKVFNAEYYTFAVLCALNDCMSICLSWCNTPESITPVLHQIAPNGVILPRVLHRI